MTRVLLALGVVLLTSLPAASEDRWRRVLVPVTDTRPAVDELIAPDLLLRIVRVPHARIRHFGWSVEVVAYPRVPDSPNLLVPADSRQGSSPVDVLAWMTRQSDGPGERRLAVRGHPYEVRIRVVDVTTEVVGEDTGFLAGVLEVSWRRARR